MSNKHRRSAPAVAPTRAVAPIRPLFDANALLLGETDAAQFVRTTIDAAYTMVKATKVVMLLKDERTGALRLFPESYEQQEDTALCRLIGEQTMITLMPVRTGPRHELPPALQSRIGPLDRALVCVPVGVHGRMMGALLACRSHSFSRVEEDTLALLASQVAVALENDRLYTQRQRQAEQLTHLTNLGTSLAATLLLDDVLHVAAKHMQQALPISGGVILLANAENSAYTHIYPFGQGIDVMAAPDVYKGLAAQVRSDGVTQIYQSGKPPVLDAWEAHLSGDDQQLICAALVSKETISGVVVLVSAPGAVYGPEEVAFIEALMTPVALAVDKAQMHASIVQTETRYRTLLNHARDAVLVLDKTASHIIDANPAAELISGYSREELLNIHPRKLVLMPPLGRGVPSQNWIDHPGEFQADIVSRDGAVLPMEIGLSNVRHDGEDYLLLIARDISERLRLAQRLAQSEKLAGMGRLASCIAHEINNPLQALHSSLHLLTSRPETIDPEKRGRYLTMAQSEVERLSMIVRKMLEFYRPSREGMRPISLHETLEATLALANDDLQARNIRVYRELLPTLPRVQGISHHLRQVLLSLVQNAAEAMPAGGTLTVRTFTYDDNGRHMAAIEITDTGTGISADELQFIFEPFYTTKITGTGLGLAISYTIVEQHEGILSASSTAQSTTFRVALPILTPGR